jgi:predicted TPR repeat methyltransferase
LIFTLECAEGGDVGLGYRLELHGRYSHSASYVERLLSRVGLTAKVSHAELRMESGAPVAGLVIRAMKPPTA